MHRLDGHAARERRALSGRFQTTKNDDWNREPPRNDRPRPRALCADGSRQSLWLCLWDDTREAPPPLPIAHKLYIYTELRAYL